MSRGAKRVDYFVDVQPGVARAREVYWPVSVFFCKTESSFGDD